MILYNIMNIRLIHHCYIPERETVVLTHQEVKMKEGWNDRGQKTAAELKNLRTTLERKEHITRSSAHWGRCTPVIGERYLLAFLILQNVYFL